MALESSDSRRKRTLEIIKILSTEFPNARCALDYKNAFELLVATILSAQCTDKRVNMVTPHLFSKYPDAESLAKASQADVEKIIQSTGFFRQKAKSIIQTSQGIVEKFNGEVPKSLAELTQLRGVARKTANVVLGEIYGIAEGVVVDTHVSRISQLLGLSAHQDPKKIEKDLCKLLPEEHWIKFSHLLILHGRKTCIARRPQCGSCPLLGLCPRKGLKALPKPKKELSYQELVEKAPTTRAIRSKKR